MKGLGTLLLAIIMFVGLPLIGGWINDVFFWKEVKDLVVPEMVIRPSISSADERYIGVWEINSDPQYWPLHDSLGIEMPINYYDWEETANGLGISPKALTVEQYMQYMRRGL